jgi:CRP-like cAMP-binding protein
MTSGLEPATMTTGLFRGPREIPATSTVTGGCRLPMVDGVNNAGSEAGETAIIYEGLRGLAPFVGLTEAELADIAAKMQRHRFAPGDVIIRQGDLGETFYLVTSGTVNVVRRAGARGPEHHVTTLGPGTCFGERALIEDELRNASIVAAEEVEVYALTKTDFWKLLGQIPNFRGLIKKIDLKRK